MSRISRDFEAKIFHFFRRQPPHGVVHRGAFWMFVVYLGCSVAGLLPGWAGETFRIFRALLLFPLLLFSVILLFRWITGELLWKVRNRLIVTYLLMGLAPLVLFVTLALLASYVFSGQFATFAASSAFQTELAHLSSEDRDFALHVAHALAADPKARLISLPDYDHETKASGHNHMYIGAFENGRKLRLAQGAQGPASLDRVPAWAEDGFQGIVLDGSRLYLRSIQSETVAGHTATLIASVPVEKQTLDRLAEGLGNIHIFSSDFIGEDADNPQHMTGEQASPSAGTVERRPHFARGTHEEGLARPISGGALRPARNFFDVPVTFAAPLETVDWQTGKRHGITLGVSSRPSLLYDHLFTTSLQEGSVMERVLIGIAAFFCILELIAFFMAVRLNQTITESIHDLYRATTEIDKGNLGYRIAAKRNDQLAALSRSFDRMASSLARLLLEQREKQRLENELNIAQEVQANLFPSENVSLPTLELHGVCRPARAVSGDYYDFLVLGQTQMFLALGDISGKGISAALLMATLHSAVRAYQFAGEELQDAGLPASSRPYRTHLLEEESAGIFKTPGKLLELLNRHLYRSTQPEKYATLFLAHYDAITRKLTYSNGGQLPPLLLCSDGSVKRLDCGGTVVGLLDGVRYEQGSVPLHEGDILIAYSDGVTEPENEFGDFGEERLLDIVRRNRHLSLATISDQVLHALRAWIGDQEQPDDITLVLARYRAITI